MKIIVRVRVRDGVTIRVRGRSLKCSYQAITLLMGGSMSDQSQGQSHVLNKTALGSLSADRVGNVAVCS
jgi:hypothetical protein